VVSHHLDGFLRRASCGFVAPRSRSWGSPRCGLAGSGAEAPSRLRPSATLHPSKPLHARSSPPCLHGSPGRLPSCRSPSEDGSTPGFFSTGRVHGLTRRPCGHGTRTASLGFFFSRASSFRAPATRSRGSWIVVGLLVSRSREGRTAPGQALGAASSPFASRRRDSRVHLSRGTAGKCRSVLISSPGPPRAG
jgi:hypothetical protein